MRTWTAILAAIALSFVGGKAGAQEKAGKYWLFIGTYSDKTSKGIYRAEYDSATGKVGTPELAAEAMHPSFLAIHPGGKLLYAVSEVAEGPAKVGVVIAYKLDPKTGGLTKLNTQPCGGAGPCHVVVDRSGKTVLVANYGGGSSCSLPLQADGKLAPPASVIVHAGSSVNKGRQGEPHAHSINVDPTNRFAYVADLGIDKVLIYKLDAHDGTIVANDPAYATVEPGAGPRHFCFHPSGKFAYVINELNSTVTAFDFDDKTGALTRMQSITTLPRSSKGNSSTAEVVAHPNGKLLFGSNRGHDSIAIFKVDPKKGLLTIVGHQGQGVKTPRNFTLDPSGNFLLVGNQGSASLAVFRVDTEAGTLTPLGAPLPCPTPVCLRFAKRE